MRIAVYTDYAYGRDAEGVYAERAFALFLAALAGEVDRMVVVGRLRPEPGAARYRLPSGVHFVPLPFYESLASPGRVLVALVGSMRRFWRGLDEVDACWLLGPHPLAIAFAALARLRGRRVYLGVRQDLVAYAESRHPGRRGFRVAASVLEGVYQALGRAFPVVVVGPALAQRYSRSCRLLEIAVSLVSEHEVVSSDEHRDYSATVRVVSVGRIDEEKNPLMLAEVLARLRAGGDRDWRLVVCGEGPLRPALERRLHELGVADSAELLGYVPHGAMRAIYESSHALLHVSWTEGLPQVIIESLAARLPTVATDVGGIGEAVGDATILIGPGDVDGATAALGRLVNDPVLRERLGEAGTRYACSHTLEGEVQRVAAFLEG